MATFIVLIDFTEQGIRNFKDTSKRAKAFAEIATRSGVTVKDVYWTVGPHDGVLIFDAPDDETAASILLWLGGQGNVRTKSLRAFDRSQISSIIDKMP